MLTLKHCIIASQTLHCTDDSILCFKPLTRGVFGRGKVNKHCLQCNKPRLTKEKKAYLFLRSIVVVVCVATVTSVKKKYQSTITNLSSSVGKIVRWFEKI
jgi:hypothetical protein